MSMDAVEFVNKMNRMCAKYPGCVGCPIETENQDEDCMSKVPAEQMVAIVEKWTSEHPRKTRQSVLLAQWPNCMMGDDGVVGMCPRNVDKNYICDLNRSAGCPDCRREFWMQEVE